jgi:hypothetical protein
MLRLSDKRSCAVSYNPPRTPWLSRADGGSVGPHNRHLQNDACNRFRSAQARSHSPVGLDTEEAVRRESHAFRQKKFTHRSEIATRAIATNGWYEAPESSLDKMCRTIGRWYCPYFRIDCSVLLPATSGFLPPAGPETRLMRSELPPAAFI